MSDSKRESKLAIGGMYGVVVGAIVGAIFGYLVGAPYARIGIDPRIIGFALKGAILGALVGWVLGAIIGWIVGKDQDK